MGPGLETRYWGLPHESRHAAYHIIAQAGAWENLSTVQGDEQPWSMLPRIWGELVKAKHLSV